GKLSSPSHYLTSCPLQLFTRREHQSPPQVKRVPHPPELANAPTFIMFISPRPLSAKRLNWAIGSRRLIPKHRCQNTSSSFVIKMATLGIMLSSRISAQKRRWKLLAPPCLLTNVT